jgi:hypothetical protein
VTAYLRITGDMLMMHGACGNMDQKNFKNFTNWQIHANGHPTEKISEFVDFHLRPHVEALPSHLKDITEYLQKMESMNPLPSGTILVSMDVTSLYTNIPHNDGIEACREAWDQRAVKEPPTECLVQLLALVLKHNNFTFNGEHFLQINGTAMGTKMAPTALWSQASRHASIPSLCGMLVYNDVTSIETRMVPEGRGFMDSIF